MPLYPNGSTTQPKVSSPYGQRDTGFHEGVDWVGFSDQVAVLAGLVTWAGYINARAGRGVIFTPDVDTAAEVRYFHTASEKVAKGARVAAGQVISVTGSTGDATGPHLHFEVRVGGVVVDPVAWLNTHGVSGGSSSGSSDVGSVTVARAVDVIQALVGANSDGIYGPDTTAKVKSWQGSNGLAADGIWGPASDAKGFAVDGVEGTNTIRIEQYRLRITVDGSRGPETIKAWQRKLGVTDDGIFGPDSIRAEQTWLGVTVDGIRGPETIKALQTRIFAGAI